MKFSTTKRNTYGILSIDPGIRGTGICVWDSSIWKSGENPIHVENFDPKTYDKWDLTAEKYSEKLHLLMERYFIRKVYCEFPQYFDSALGYAASSKGDINKLSFLVGVFAGVTYGYGGIFDTILVNHWKGQLTKDAVIARIKRKYPTLEATLKPTTHSWDAIGIGMHAQGYLFVNK